MAGSPLIELPCLSPCACGIIHKAVTLSGTSIKQRLHPAGVRAYRRTARERKTGGREQKIGDGDGE